MSTLNRSNMIMADHAWARAFVALNSYDQNRRDRMLRMHRWLRLCLPKSWLRVLFAEKLLSSRG